MKHCKVCARVLPLSEFPIRSYQTLKPCAYCKPCQRQYSRTHYAQHAHQHNHRRYANQKRYRRRNRQRLWEYLRGKSCVDCGNRDPIVLEFDHVRGDKIANLSEMVSNGFPWRHVAAELEKCDIRCANCHRRRTAYQLKWFRAAAGA